MIYGWEMTTMPDARDARIRKTLPEGYQFGDAGRNEKSGNALMLLQNHPPLTAAEREALMLECLHSAKRFNWRLEARRMHKRGRVNKLLRGNDAEIPGK